MKKKYSSSNEIHHNLVYLPKKLLLGSVKVAVVDEHVDQMHLIYCQTFALFIRFKRTDYYAINKSKINIHSYLIKINDNNYLFMYLFFLDIDHEQVHTTVCLLGCFPEYKWKLKNKNSFLIKKYQEILWLQL